MKKTYHFVPLAPCKKNEACVVPRITHGTKNQIFFIFLCKGRLSEALLAQSHHYGQSHHLKEGNAMQAKQSGTRKSRVGHWMRMGLGLLSFALFLTTLSPLPAGALGTAPIVPT